LDGAYHGDTFGAMATGRTTGFYTPFEPFLCDVKFIPYPDTYYDDDLDILIKREQESLDYLSQMIDKYHEKIACLILEPLMQGAKGMRFCRPEFVKKLCDMARSADILVIFDEVATGFGRTGTLFAFEQIGFIPDFLCLSKGLTAGYMPLSVTLTHKKIYDAFLGGDFKNAFTHGHSFTANPLACAVASASLKLFDTQPLGITVKKIHNLYHDIIKTLQSIDSITKIRSLGTVLAWDLKIADADYKSKTSEILKDKFLEMGLNIRPLGKTFYLLPPYCITEKQTDYIITCIKKVFS
jgi:adenosylmethionine-8-amino-7-oxononanoate aminotransferase